MSTFFYNFAPSESTEPPDQSAARTKTQSIPSNSATAPVARVATTVLVNSGSSASATPTKKCTPAPPPPTVAPFDGPVPLLHQAPSNNNKSVAAGVIPKVQGGPPGMAPPPPPPPSFFHQNGAGLPPPPNLKMPVVDNSIKLPNKRIAVTKYFYLHIYLWSKRA